MVIFYDGMEHNLWIHQTLTNDETILNAGIVVSTGITKTQSITQNTSITTSYDDGTDSYIPLVIVYIIL